MEALDSSNRQSGIPSIIHREKIDHITIDRPPYTSAPAMAATAVVSPSSMYSNGPPPPYSSGWSGPAAHSMSGLISPPDSRRTSDNKAEPPPPIQTAQPHRQSLPSIHEALSNGPKSNPYASPVSASLPASHQLPYSQPQAPSIPPRSYPPADHAAYPTQLAPSQPRQPSPPQPVHPQPNPFSRTEQGPGNFPEVARHPSLTTLQAAPAPHNPYAAPRYEPARYEQDHRAPERAPNSYGPPPPQPPPSYVLGPGLNQMPPSGYQGPQYSQPRYYPQDRRESEGWKEGEKSEIGGPFKVGLKRRLDVWDFEMNLSEINMMSGAIQEWSAHYNAIAQEQQRSANAIPDRMPTLESLNDMIISQTKIGECLKRMQTMILQQQKDFEETQYMRDQGVRGPGSYDEEMSLYGDDMKNHGFGSESKKRRGRAAPPGRCHSCNRAETPEWRRGPDGARTLCNACGLHYAKLTRKNTMKQSQGSNGSSLRPKSMDEVSPRPL